MSGSLQRILSLEPLQAPAFTGFPQVEQAFRTILKGPSRPEPASASIDQLFGVTIFNLTIVDDRVAPLFDAKIWRA